MRAASLSSLGIERRAIPVVDCPACGRTAVVYVDVDADGRDVERCLDCDAPVDAPSARRVGSRELGALGYGLLEHGRKAGPPPKLSGCGTRGVRSCGSGGCGSGGGCSSGGCSSGGCGSR